MAKFGTLSTKCQRPSTPEMLYWVWTAEPPPPFAFACRLCPFGKNVIHHQTLFFSIPKDPRSPNSIKDKKIGAQKFGIVVSCATAE
ncbi:hypothetical protein FF1_029525 [Malus domestica]